MSDTTEVTELGSETESSTQPSERGSVDFQVPPLLLTFGSGENPSLATTSENENGQVDKAIELDNVNVTDKGRVLNDECCHFYGFLICFLLCEKFINVPVARTKTLGQLLHVVTKTC